MTTTNKKIKYGNVELPADTFDPKNMKVRITTMIDYEILRALKAEGARRRIGYQTLLNELLRDWMNHPKPSTEDRLRALEAVVLKTPRQFIQRAHKRK